MNSDINGAENEMNDDTNNTESAENNAIESQQPATPASPVNTSTQEPERKRDRRKQGQGQGKLVKAETNNSKLATSTEVNRDMSTNAESAKQSVAPGFGESTAVTEHLLQRIDQTTTYQAEVLAQATQDMPFATLHKYQQIMGGVQDRSQSFRDAIDSQLDAFLPC